MTKNVEGRMATLEANVLNISNTLESIKYGSERNFEKRSEQHLEVIRKLTLIEGIQKNFTEYQKRCDQERKSMNVALIGCVETQKVHKRVVGIFGSILATMVGALEFIRH